MSSHLKIVIFLLLRIRMNLFFFQMEYTENLDGFTYNVLLQKHKNVCDVCVVFFFLLLLLLLYLFVFLWLHRIVHTYIGALNQNKRRRRRKKKYEAKEADWTHNKHNNKNRNENHIIWSEWKLNTSEQGKTHMWASATSSVCKFIHVGWLCYSACLYIFVHTLRILPYKFKAQYIGYTYIYIDLPCT